MKNIIKSLALAILFILAISSCKKQDNPIANQVAILNSNAQQSSWKITSYINSGSDGTVHYTDNVFQFNSNGTTTVTKSGSTVSGTWSSGNDDNTLKFILDFGAIVPFSELNDDWHVIEQSSTLIKLTDVSGGTGNTDYLTFQNN